MKSRTLLHLLLSTGHEIRGATNDSDVAALVGEITKSLAVHEVDTKRCQLTYSIKGKDAITVVDLTKLKFHVRRDDRFYAERNSEATELRSSNRQLACEIWSDLTRVPLENIFQTINTKRDQETPTVSRRDLGTTFISVVLLSISLLLDEPISGVIYGLYLFYRYMNWSFYKRLAMGIVGAAVLTIFSTESGVETTATALLLYLMLSTRITNSKQRYYMTLLGLFLVTAVVPELYLPALLCAISYGSISVLILQEVKFPRLHLLTLGGLGVLCGLINVPPTIEVGVVGVVLATLSLVIAASSILRSTKTSSDFYLHSTLLGLSCLFGTSLHHLAIVAIAIELLMQMASRSETRAKRLSEEPNTVGVPVTIRSSPQSI